MSINENQVRERYLDDIRIHQLHDNGHGINHLTPMINTNGMQNMRDLNKRSGMDRNTLAMHYNIRENFMNMNANNAINQLPTRLNLVSNGHGGGAGAGGNSGNDSRQHLIRFTQELPSANPNVKLDLIFLNQLFDTKN
jgi:hypothetical protein